MNLPASALAAFGIAVLAYRILLTLRYQFRFQVWELAVRSSVRTAASADPLIMGLSIPSLFDFDRARILLDQRVDAGIGVALVTIGAGCSLVSLLVRREDPVLPIIVRSAAVGIAFAWTLEHVYHYVWRLFSREACWLAHAWLNWLERQTPDPLDHSSSPPSADPSGGRTLFSAPGPRELPGEEVQEVLTSD